MPYKSSQNTGKRETPRRYRNEGEFPSLARKFTWLFLLPWFKSMVTVEDYHITLISRFWKTNDFITHWVRGIYLRRGASELVENPWLNSNTCKEALQSNTTGLFYSSVSPIIKWIPTSCDYYVPGYLELIFLSQKNSSLVRAVSCLSLTLFKNIDFILFENT